MFFILWDWLTIHFFIITSNLLFYKSKFLKKTFEPNIENSYSYIYGNHLFMVIQFMVIQEI